MINFVVRPRTSGKTMGLVRWALDRRNRYIVTATEAEADRLRRQNPSLSEQIISWNSSRTLMGKKDVVVSIDNLDLLLQGMMPGATIDFVTATGEAI